MVAIWKLTQSFYVSVATHVIWMIFCFEVLKMHYLYIECQSTNIEENLQILSYIDSYHQLAIVVWLWREYGNLAIKPHYLMHDLKHTFLTVISNAYSWWRSIQNVNQLIKAIMQLYQNCQGNRFGSKEMFAGRRMNNSVFFWWLNHMYNQAKCWNYLIYFVHWCVYTLSKHLCFC